MGERINDGGPAFPDPVAIRPDGTVLPSNWPGMSLRDWFAGQALIGLCSQDAILAQVSVTSGQNPARIAAAAAYIAADAMLAARQDGLQAPAPDGYTEAFYEIAALLGIGAKPYSPKEAFERDIKPRLQALLAAERGGA